MVELQGRLQGHIAGQGRVAEQGRSAGQGFRARYHKTKIEITLSPTYIITTGPNPLTRKYLWTSGVTLKGRVFP